jgi:hypothetical protein
LGIDDDGTLPRANELVEDDGCFDFIGWWVSSAKLFPDCEGVCLSSVSWWLLGMTLAKIEFDNRCGLKKFSLG